MTRPAPGKYKFTGHQTFAFRYGWLEKGVQGAKECPDLFWRDDAIIRLGVGKNMVASIRHWCEVSQLIEAEPVAKRAVRPTVIATKLLLSGNGQAEVVEAWDPYLEDDASLWLLHWLIATNPNIGTIWQLLFSQYRRQEFSRSELTATLLDFAAKRGLRATESTIRRDVDCLIRSYVPQAIDAKGDAIAEETFYCPLHQLDLIQPSYDVELYRFAIGPKPTLPPAVFAFALHQHFETRQSTSQAMSVQECLYGEGSAGQVFKLDENSLIEYLEEIEERMPGKVILDETAGLRQILRKSDYDPFAVLDDYYRGKWRR